MAAWALTGLVTLLIGGDLSTDLAREVDRSGVKRRGLSVVVGAAGSEPCLSIAPDAPRIPASNQKLVTAAAALELLGRDFRFRTRIGTGPADELVVVGDGDPNLSGRWFDGDASLILRAMARDVAAKGIRKLPGGILLDATRFDDVTTHPDWPTDQLDRWYCAPVAALVYNDSCWDVTVRPGARAGSPARIEVLPALLRPELSNRCSTVATRGEHVVHVGRGNGSTELEVRGRILLTSQGVTGNVTVRDPVGFFGNALRAALEAEGIEVVGGLRRAKAPEFTPLLVYRTDLARTLRVMLTNSQNLYAECTFKRLGSGSYPSAAEAAKGALEKLGVPTRGLEIRDGSGLARTNRVTARALYALLQAMRAEPHFVDALAAGGEGTLRRYFKDLGERVRAKTGYIRGVKALSGYVDGQAGGRYVFVVLANGASAGRARDLQKRLVQRLARAP